MRFIGCKALLLDNIKSVIDENAPDAKSFCDIFSGTATVARYFKQWYEVTSNDLLYFSYVLQRGTVAVDCLPTYEILQENTGISDPVAYFNGLSLEQMERLPPERRFFQNTYAPIGGRMYINVLPMLPFVDCRMTLTFILIEMLFWMAAITVCGTTDIYAP